MPTFQDAINDFPIVDYLQSNFSNVRVGHEEITADCPFCGGYRKFSIHRVTRLCKCFRCKDGGHALGWPGYGNLFKLLVYRGMSRKDAYQYICAQAGMPDVVVELTRNSEIEEPLIPRETIPLSTLPDHEPAIQYLKKRHVGHLIPYSGVCVEGKYKDRIALRCLYDGYLAGSEMKSLFQSVRPKSLFHPRGVFLTHKTVYSSLDWDSKRKEAVVTESILDAETFGALGINAIGLYGCHVHEAQVSAILALGVERLIWALDGDAWHKLLEGFKLTSENFTNAVVNFGIKDDPNSIGPAGCTKVLQDARTVKDEWDLFQLAVEWGKW